MRIQPKKMNILVSFNKRICYCLMRIFCCFFIFIQPLKSHSQDSTKTNNYKYKIGIKLNVDRSGAAHRSFNNIDENEKSKVYSGGILFIDRINKTNFSLESGLYYLRQSAVSSFPFYNNGVYVGYFEIPFYYNSISIPVCIRYDTKVLYFSCGFNTNYMYSRTLNDENLNSYNDTLSDYYERNQISDRKFNVGLNFTIGIEKQINGAFNLFVEWHYLENFTSIQKSDEASLNSPHFRNVGYSLGVNYNFTNQRK